MNIPEAPLSQYAEVCPDTSTPVLPSVFPTHFEVYDMLLDAVRVCVGDNMLAPIMDVVGPSLSGNRSLFNDSIMYKTIGLDGSLDLFKGNIPVQQFVGKILHDEDAILAFNGPNQNPIINSISMSRTRVIRNTSNNILVHHVLPSSDSLHRYLLRVGLDYECNSELSQTTVIIDIPTDADDMSGLIYAADNMHSALTIYFKLLTRFPSCQAYQNCLPGFQTS